jgi:hypothetical protein
MLDLWLKLSPAAALAVLAAGQVKSSSGMSDDHKNKIMETVNELKCRLTVPKPFTWIVHVSGRWRTGVQACAVGWVAAARCSGDPEGQEKRGGGQNITYD